MPDRSFYCNTILQYAEEHGCGCLDSHDFWVFSTRELKVIVEHGESAIRAVIVGAMEFRGKPLPYEFVAVADAASTKWAEAADLR